MASGTEEQKQTAELGPDFPYRDYMEHPAWAVVRRAIEDVVANSDIELQTPVEYVVGYLIQSLLKKGLLPPVVAKSSAGENYRWVALFDTNAYRGKPRAQVARKK